MSIQHVSSSTNATPSVAAWSWRARSRSVPDMGSTSAGERDYRRRLGRVIVQMREATSTSQATLAAAINRSEAALSRWETGKATPTAYDLRQIADHFGLMLDTVDVLIYPPAVYGPEMERVFASIDRHLYAAAVSGHAEGRRRAAEARPQPAPSPVRRPRDTAAGRG